MKYSGVQSLKSTCRHLKVLIPSHDWKNTVLMCGIK